jgi:hypothetical protein
MQAAAVGVFAFPKAELARRMERKPEAISRVTKRR